MQNKFFKRNKGITGIDIVIAVMIIIIFTGLISTFMYNLYRINLETLKNANANAYATIILEKVDEKAFEEVTDDFVDKLIHNNELKIDSAYTVEFSQKTENDLIKKVDLKIKYTVENSNKSIEISKLKIKEIGE